MERDLRPFDEGTQVLDPDTAASPLSAKTSDSPFAADPFPESPAEERPEVTITTVFPKVPSPNIGLRRRRVAFYFLTMAMSVGLLFFGIGTLSTKSQRHKSDRIIQSGPQLPLPRSLNAITKKRPTKRSLRHRHR